MLNVSERNHADRSHHDDMPGGEPNIIAASTGMLEVLAGRNLDLGTGANLADGTGVGITSIGSGRNPFLQNGRRICIRSGPVVKWEEFTSSAITEYFEVIEENE